MGNQNSLQLIMIVRYFLSLPNFLVDAPATQTTTPKMDLTWLAISQMLASPRHHHVAINTYHINLDCV